jgi:hypothetical protein
MVDSTSYAVERKGPWKIFRKRSVSVDTILTAIKKETAETAGIHVKSITGIGPRQNLKDLFQGARGRRAYVALCGFAFRGLPAPEGLALVEKRSAGFLRESRLLTRRIEGAEELARFIHRNFIAPRFGGEPADAAKKSRFIAALAAEVRRMHEAGVSHGDLKGENLLIREENGKFRIYFVDLDSVRFREHIGFSRIAWNLAQLDASVPYCVGTRPRLRFLIEYVRGTGLAPMRKELAREAARLSKKRVAAWLDLYWRERKKAEEAFS